MQSNSLQTKNSQPGSIVQEILHEIHIIDNKHYLVNALNHLEKAIESHSTSIEDMSMTSILSKLLQKVFSLRLFQVFVFKDSDTRSRLLGVLNNQKITRLSLYQALILQTLPSLQDSPFSEVRLEYERKNLFEEILLAALIDQEHISQLFIELFEEGSSGEFAEILKTILSMPTRVANYLETCPLPIKHENFFSELIEVGFSQEMSFKKAKEEQYVQFVNGLFINGQTRLFVQSWIDYLTNNYKESSADAQWKDDFVLNMLAKRSDKMYNYVKVIREVLLVFSRASEDSFTYETKVSIIKHLLMNVETSQFVSNYTPRLANDIEFNSVSARILADTIINYPKLKQQSSAGDGNSNLEFLSRTLESCLALWSETGFIQNASKKHLKFLSNLLRRLVINTDNHSLQKPELIELIQQGVSHRLTENALGPLQRQCAEAVWTAFIRRLGIKDAIELIKKEGLYDDEVKDDKEDLEEKEKEEKKSTTRKADGASLKEEAPKKPKAAETKDSDDDDEFFQVEQDVEEESIFSLSKPKHIYDCLLGLRSDDRERFEYSLKYVNYLIRKRLSDVEFIAEELALTLCKINNQYEWESFDEYRSRALISLVIIIPESISQCLIKRFFYSETSLGEKILMLDIFEKSTKELSDNPEKYNPELYNEYKDEQSFYFKPTTVKYYTAEEKQQEEIDRQKQEKVEQNTRRWGDTKRKKEQEKTLGSNLTTMDTKELMIINSDSEKIYINRFNSLCNHFFFPLVVPLREKKKYMLKEHILLGKVVSLMKVYLVASKNSPIFYSLLEEVLDFLLGFVKVDDNNVMQEILSCFYLVSTIMNRNVIMYYQNIVQKLLLLMKIVTDMGQKVEKFKIFVYEISTNLQKLFEFGMPSQI